MKRRPPGLGTPRGSGGDLADLIATATAAMEDLADELTRTDLRRLPPRQAMAVAGALMKLQRAATRCGAAVGRH